MADPVVTQHRIPRELLRGGFDVLLDRSGFVAIIGEDQTIACPECNNARAFFLIEQPYLFDANVPAALAATWVYHCFTCPIPPAPTQFPRAGVSGGVAA